MIVEHESRLVQVQSDGRKAAEREQSVPPSRSDTTFSAIDGENFAARRVADTKQVETKPSRVQCRVRRIAWMKLYPDPATILSPTSKVVEKKDRLTIANATRR